MAGRRIRNGVSLKRRLQGRRRKLLAEPLEQRMLLTTITSLDPAAASNSAPVTTDVAATFDENINAATATADNFVVRSSMRAGTVAVSADGMTVTADPSSNFFPGEQVQVTATGALQGAATPVEPTVWQFRTEVTSGSGQFVDSGQVLSNSSTGGRTLAGDIDGDGDVDVVEGLNGTVWINDGNAVFTAGQVLSAGTSIGESSMGDLDGDGDLDVFGTTNIFLNDGTGTFTPTGQGVTGATTAVGDLDGDGDLDAMVGVNYAPKRVWFNDGNGTFTNSGQALGTVSSSGIEFGDFDGDGDLDAYAAISGGSGNEVWVNDGSGVFTNSGQALGGFRSSTDVDVGDVDGDGDLDAVVTNDYGVGARIWLNDGDGNFAETGVGHDALRGRRAELADVDGDGDLDLVNSVLWDGSSVWLNDGSGAFSDTGQRLDFDPDNVVRRVEGGGLADLDGDGDMDYFESNIGTGGSRVWINQNLQPNVSLSIDNATVAEAAGVATVTATLSAAHTQPVTIDLGVSGTATESDDFTISATQITIATGATSGTVTITAVQDTVDEPDETVIVDITSVANADEAGTQQVTATILDDDEPIPVPDVTLTVDNGAIPEAAGVATFTASLSVPTTVPVTIDFAVSGTADAGDYTSSATQIVVAPGATSGTLTITAVQDEVDEPDETVVVDIAAVTGGTEAGTQQQTTTITDDDEPVAPDVTLTLDNATIPEAAGVANFTITLSEATTVPVTVGLGITGTATATDDYTVSATEVTIAAGSTSAAVTVTAVQDETDEPDETVIVDIASVAGGNELGDQQQTTTILDDDIPPSFAVTSLTAGDSSITIELSNPVDATDLNLYDTQNAAMGASDVVVTGATSGPVSGSILVDGTTVTFIKSGGPLEADTYTVQLRSGTDAFKDTGGQLLDGNTDGTGGDDYEGSVTVAAAPEGARLVSIPDFVRGPGQDVNLPANETIGIPITISEGDNVRAADIRIAYDPSLLEITGATAAPGGTVVLNTTTTPGVAILVYFSTTALPAGPGTLINLQATVPTANASDIYEAQQLLDVHAVTIGDGNDNEFPVVVDDATHFVTYFADVSGNGRINASDAAQVARFAALIDSGFATSLNTDPLLIGDISGNGRINAADASRVAQFAALIPVDEIPPVPGGVVITGVVPDAGIFEDTNVVEASLGVTNALDQREAEEGGFQVVERFQSSQSAEPIDVILAEQEETEFNSELEAAIDELLN